MVQCPNGISGVACHHSFAIRVLLSICMVAERAEPTRKDVESWLMEIVKILEILERKLAKDATLKQGYDLYFQKIVSSGIK